MTKTEAQTFIRELQEKNSCISISSSSTSNEIAGKLAKNDWREIEWDSGKPGWKAHGLNSYSMYISEESFLEVLATGEDWDL